MFSADIKAGNTVRDGINRLSTEGIDTYDVTLIECMRSDVSTDAVNTLAESSTIGAYVIELCTDSTPCAAPSSWWAEAQTFGASASDGM